MNIINQTQDMARRPLKIQQTHEASAFGKSVNRASSLTVRPREIDIESGWSFEIQGVCRRRVLKTILSDVRCGIWCICVLYGIGVANVDRDKVRERKSLVILLRVSNGLHGNLNRVRAVYGLEIGFVYSSMFSCLYSSMFPLLFSKQIWY